MRGPGPGWEAWDAALRRRPAARARSPPAPGSASTRSRSTVLWPRARAVPVEPGAHRPRHQRHLDRAARRGERPAVPAHRRRRGRRGPALLARGPPAARRAQGRPPRERDGDQRRAARRHAPGVALDLGREPATTTATRRRRRSRACATPGARVYRTDRDGTVEVDLRRTALAVGRPGARRTRPRPRRRRTLAVRARPRRHRLRFRGMTVPARREAARLLLSLDPPAWFLRHACAVADVAAWLARAIAARRARRSTCRAVEAAALLHDVDKLPARGRMAGLRHGDGSAAWLEARGMAELAPLVRDHPVHAPRRRRATPPGSPRPRSRRGSWPTRTSGPASAWRRWTSGSPRGGAGTRRARGAGARDGRPAAERPGLGRRGRAARARRAPEPRARDLRPRPGVEPRRGVRRLRWSRRALREAAPR